MTVEKPIPNLLLQPITTGANNTINQSEFLEITWNSPKVREKSHVQGAISFDFASHCLKNWCWFFLANCTIAFDSHLQTALCLMTVCLSSIYFYSFIYYNLMAKKNLNVHTNKAIRII